ncbi:hypothetical protein LXT21_34720 [Myxococcus sp. K38C18041901]|uniref:hypothetical protein n=1 Tax=Myxococcus guangdongensis TaxID=2906760 RepID=UPI0020A73919|nr:hypothetical protein [Myxococcus guangdongensis]MCP3063944.1 hypothetical protein [Myxococcus guangdongensis]
MLAGLAADGTYAAGARHTMDVSAEDAWRNWAEGSGLGRWLSSPRTALKEGERTTLKDGTEVLAVRVRPPALLRIRLTRADWPRPRTAQLRVLPAARGHTVALHMEGLPDAASRAGYIQQWKKALSGLTSQPAKKKASARGGATKKTGAKAASKRKAGARKAPVKKAGTRAAPTNNKTAKAATKKKAGPGKKPASSRTRTA